MFYIIQSNDTRRLLAHLIRFYKNKEQVFMPFQVIVPSMVIGDWVQKEVAKQTGISTLFVAEFWGKYQWQMMSDIIKLDAKAHPNDVLSVPEVAVLSGSIMRWRLFDFLSNKSRHINKIDKDDVLAFLLLPLVEEDEHGAPFIAEHRLWQLCQELSNVYVRYLTHRPKWLLDWALNKSLQNTVKKMMADKAKFDEQFIVIRPDDFGGRVLHDRWLMDWTLGKMLHRTMKHIQSLASCTFMLAMFGNHDYQKPKQTPPEPMPDWLQEHYLSLEKALHFLWCELFGQTYLYRHSLEKRFWQILQGNRGKELALSARAKLETLYLFTVQQIPQVELDFLKRLSQYSDIHLLHFNPSKMFWADIVDKYWLEHQRIINREHVHLKDYGHTLLSRLGKESRETFAMLVEMADMEDDFDELFGELPNQTPNKLSLLSGIKQDILVLQDKNMAKDFTLSLAKNMLTPLPFDDSLSIHACHSLKRQLELARLYIAQYLNTPKSDGSRPNLSDVVILLPDVAKNEDVIRAVFPDGRGMDGLSLPIKITGVPDKKISDLVNAILGFYELLGKPTSRFYAQDVYEWLLTPPLYESFGLSFEEMKRGCELLTQAGFKRGFDERHLAKTLDEADNDYRYTFSYALDRVVLGLISPNIMGTPQAYDTLHPFAWQENAFAEKVLPLVGVQLSDEPIITALTAIHQGLDTHRDDYTKVDVVEHILDSFEKDIIDRYFDKLKKTVEMRAIFNTKNTIKASLRANANYDNYQNNDKGYKKSDIALSCQFVLQSLAETTIAQAVSAEPSSVITVARFGAVRSIPFGLTVMLDMNLSSFPRQDKSVRLDLMRAGLKWRGDRYNEDDDNGAFLDALLCTDKAMIFYNGLSPDGKNTLLPASPVSELVKFLTEEAKWEGEVDDNDGMDMNKISRAMSSLVKDYLITWHCATPFDEQNFYVNQGTDDDSYGVLEPLKRHIEHLKHERQCYLPPAPLWQSVWETLCTPTVIENKVALLDAQTLAYWAGVFRQTWTLMALYQAQPNHDNAQALYNHICTTGKPHDDRLSNIIRSLKDMIGAFLEPKIGLPSTQYDTELDEPLSLDSLGKYQVNEMFLEAVAAGAFDEEQCNDDVMTNKTLQPLYYDSLLPAGVVRQQMPHDIKEHTMERFKQFFEGLQNVNITLPTLDTRRLSLCITKLHEQKVAIGIDGMVWYHLTDRLPHDSPVWFYVSPSKPRPKHLLNFWLRHLLWQLTDDEVPTGTKISIWQFAGADSTLKQYKDKTTFYLPAIAKAEAVAHLTNFKLFATLAQTKPIIMTVENALIGLSRQEDKFDPNKAFGGWLDRLDENWQFVLGNADPIAMLLAHLPMTDVLFEPLLRHLKAID
ncbi:exodeoxyribonuclease V subunit gamma [Moraxella oblonga]|uniref:exodeoxyribonuclease V subunit gamma n=1 Tax=Moraxella oblonga TaxID=200413 RepID=UPI00082EB37C|nr:exodeoxyribonuclease V subunit gamma [Moraxella oblonga]